MKRSAMLPYKFPTFAGNQWAAALSIAVDTHPTAYNIFLNEATSFECSTKFMSGSYFINTNITNMHYKVMPGFDSYWINLKFTHKYYREIIKDMLDEGYYIHCTGVDDYYLPGKSWYGLRHMAHDCIICGYDDDADTFSIAAYNTNWVFDLFPVPQAAFGKAILSSFELGNYGVLIAYRIKDGKFTLREDRILRNVRQYLTEKSPNESSMVYGIATHDYIAQYMQKLKDGSIPYEMLDWRALRPVWEHKRCMYDRIRAVEEKRGLGDELSSEYKAVVARANRLRMMYAVHHKKRNDALLDSIANGLIEIKTAEKEILGRFVEILENLP